MKTNYIKSLDGIRFVAVTMVLLDHWSGDRLGFPASYLGVCMFFVLSGFLITRILLSAKEKDTALGRGHGFSLKRFYIRRTIRIFPIYYLTLALLFIFNISGSRENFLWLATYNFNNLVALNQHWYGLVDHFWSLSVEEQFYIFFPFLVLFLPLKNLKMALLLLGGMSIALRAYFFYSGADWTVSYVLMPTCLDAFALGGLLAYVQFYQKEKVLKILSKWQTPVLSLVIYSLTVLWLNSMEAHNYVTVIFLRFSEALFSVLVMGYLVSLPDGKSFLHRIFEWRPFVYIGQISYGVYIYHNFVYNAYHSSTANPFARMASWIEESQRNIFLGTSLKIIFLYLVVIAVATLSWFLIEKPINKLKNRYGY